MDLQCVPNHPKLHSFNFSRIDLTLIKKNSGIAKNRNIKKVVLNDNPAKELLISKNCQFAAFNSKIYKYKNVKSNKTWSVLLLDFYMS
jgi:hypothetical protein